LRLATHDAPAMCATVVVVCTYLLMIAGSAVIMSELQTLWFLQSQPRSLADCIRTKARVWSAIAGLVCLGLIGSALVARPEIRSDLLMRLPLMLACIWFLGEIIFGLLSLGAVLASEGSLRFRRTTWILPLLLSGQLSLAVYQGDFWSGLVSLVVLIVLSIAVRQKQQAELIWLSEPVENPPRRLYAMHGLLAILGFLCLRDVTKGILLHTGISDSNILTGGYCAAASVIAIVSWIWLRRSGLQVLPAQPRGSAWKAILVALPATCAAGFVASLLLSLHPESVQSSPVSLRLAAGGAEFNPDAWLMAALLVLVAPLFEEWVFRGLLYHSLRRNFGIFASVALTSGLFTVIHPAAGLVGVLPLGIATALVAERTGRLWPSMVIHIGYNAFVVGLAQIAIGTA